MADKVISCLNVEGLTEKIIHARRGVCYASPGVYDWVAEALIAAAECVGWDHVRVVIDASPDVIRFGYGTKQAIDRILERGGRVRTQEGLRIGVVIVDDFAAIFSPTPLNIETFPGGSRIWNAVTVGKEEAERLMSAVAPEMQEIKEKHTPEIGGDEITTSQVGVIDRSLRDSPPVAPFAGAVSVGDGKMPNWDNNPATLRLSLGHGLQHWCKTTLRRAS